MGSLTVIRSIIFDLDGTLIDSREDIRSCFRAAYEAAGKRHLLPQEIRIGPPVGEMIRLHTPGLAEKEVEAITREFRQRYDHDSYDRTRLYEGAQPLLTNLADRGVTLFLATNKPLQPTSRVLDKLGIRRNFRAVVTVDSVEPPGSGKRGMIAQILREWALDAAGTLMIGDGGQDVQAARDNGVRSVGVLSGYEDVAGVLAARPDFTVPHLLEAFPLISGLLSPPGWESR